jgi:hypothetical protein
MYIAMRLLGASEKTPMTEPQRRESLRQHTIVVYIISYCNIMSIYVSVCAEYALTTSTSRR